MVDLMGWVLFSVKHRVSCVSRWMGFVVDVTRGKGEGGKGDI